MRCRLGRLLLQVTRTRMISTPCCLMPRKSWLPTTMSRPGLSDYRSAASFRLCTYMPPVHVRRGEDVARANDVDILRAGIGEADSARCWLCFGQMLPLLYDQVVLLCYTGTRIQPCPRSRVVSCIRSYHEYRSVDLLGAAMGVTGLKVYQAYRRKRATHDTNLSRKLKSRLSTI